MKKTISLILALCMVLAMLPGINAFAAQGDLPTSLYIEPSAGNALPTRILAAKPGSGGSGWGGGIWGGGWGGWTPGGGSSASSNAYNLCLPGNVDPEACFLSWDDGLEASDGETTYKSGELPAPAPGQTKTYTFTKGSETKTFEVTCYQGSETIRPVFIEIDESQGTIAAMNGDSDHETECTGVMYVDGQKLNIPKMKGRGNSSWMQAVTKKPYNITLDKKVNLFGIDSDKTKKWSFLANVGERSLLRNQLGYDMAHDMGVGQDSAQADVWMNGKYLGLYLVTPKTDSFVSDDGFMVENDNYKEKSIAEGGDPSFDLEGLIGNGSSMAYYDYNRITVKKIGDNLLGGEENEETLTAASKVIQDYLQQAWDAIRSDDGYNSQGKYYADYVDMKSWACMYLMMDLVQNYDFCGGSLFFHREGMEDTDKLYAGPIWDLDIGFGCPQNSSNFGNKVDQLSSCTWFIRNINGKKTSMYHEIGEHPDFMEEVTKQYNIYKHVFDNAPQHLAELAKEIEASALMDAAVTKSETAGVTNISRETVKDRGTPYEATYKATSKWQDYVDNLMTYVSMRTMFFADELTTEPSGEGFEARFDCGKNSSVTVYDTQDVSGEGTPNAETAWARSSETGEIDMTGDGQINFVVNLTNGYQISDIKVEPAGNYKNLKGPGDTGVENCYRITKVTGPVTVTIVTEEFVCEHDFVDGKCANCGAEAFRVDFNCEHSSVTVYDTQDLSLPGHEKAAFAYARGSASGEIDLSGDGQVNFVVVPDEGYELVSVTAEPKNYKNLKAPDETLVENGYRATKITGDFTVTVTTKKLDSGECEHDYKAEVTEPTCETAGFTTYTCSKCGDSYKADETPALGHNIVNGKCTRCALSPFRVSFSCENCSVTVYNTQSQDGEKDDHATVAYARNSDTGDYDMSGNGQVNFVVIPDEGYELDTVTAEPKNYKNLKAPDETLVENGYRITKITGNLTVTIKAVKSECEHDYKAVVTAPTCTKAGYTTYTCSKCGHTYEGDETDALDHDYKEEAAYLPPYPCAGYSVFIYTCTRCGDTTEAEYVPAPHEWDEGKITVEPTELKEGTRLYTCKVCGETKTETIPELSHEHKYTPVVTAPTCEEDGYTTYTCTCGDSYKGDIVSAKGHKFENGKCLECGAADPDWIEPKACPSEAFTDIPEKGNWAHEGIDYCIDREYMNGVGNDLFNPLGNVTRAQLVTILYRIEGEPETAFKGTFADVADGLWYSRAIEWAAANGIVNGVGEEKFDPTGDITREQIATIFFRYAKAEEGEGSIEKFPDCSDAHAFAVPALGWAVEKGIINGVSAEGVTCLKPLDNATRAQIASIIMRYLKGGYRCGE